MEDYLARKRVKVGELEAHLLCPTEVEGVLDLLAWKVCDHRGHRKFVSESWPCKTARTAQKHTFFERTVRRKEFALINALKLPTNQQKDGRRFCSNVCCHLRGVAISERALVGDLQGRTRPP